MIPAATLAAMQAAAIKTLDKTADIQRNNSNSFALGQPVENWQSIVGGVPVPCRVAEPSNAIIQQYGDLIANQQTIIFSFAETQDIAARDRVVYAGITYAVQASLHNESYSVLNRVLCTRIG